MIQIILLQSLKKNQPVEFAGVYQQITCCTLVQKVVWPGG